MILKGNKEGWMGGHGRGKDNDGIIIISRNKGYLKSFSFVH